MFSSSGATPSAKPANETEAAMLDETMHASNGINIAADAAMPKLGC